MKTSHYLPFIGNSFKMTILIKLFFLSFFIFLSDSSFGQPPSDRSTLTGQRVPLDSLGKIRPEHYRKTLGLDSAGAGQFARIVDIYQAALQIIMQDSSLTLDSRRERMRTLIKERNQKLRGILSLRQQQKVIPTTEFKQEKAEQPVQ